MAKTVVGIFENRDKAENAARQVKEQGLRTEDISIVARGDNNSSDAAGFEMDKADSHINPTLDVSKRSSSDAAGFERTEAKGPITPFMGVGRPANDNISDGVVTGGVLGGLAGLLIGAGSLMIPGLGIVAAAGPITGLLSGTVTGGIVGGLVDLGIPEKKSRQYESDIRSGRILFSMRTDDEKAGRVAEILRNNGAERVEAY